MEIPHIIELLVSEYTMKETLYFTLYRIVTYFFVWIFFHRRERGRNSEIFGCVTFEFTWSPFTVFEYSNNPTSMVIHFV